MLLIIFLSKNNKNHQQHRHSETNVLNKRKSIQSNFKAINSQSDALNSTTQGKEKKWKPFDEFLNVCSLKPKIQISYVLSYSFKQQSQQHLANITVNFRMQQPCGIQSNRGE